MKTTARGEMTTQQLACLQPGVERSSMPQDSRCTLDVPCTAFLLTVQTLSFSLWSKQPRTASKHGRQSWLLVYLQEQLGVTFEKADEMDCLVRGCNFLQTSVPREAFHFKEGSPTYLDKGWCRVSARVVAQ